MVLRRVSDHTTSNDSAGTVKTKRSAASWLFPLFFVSTGLIFLVAPVLAFTWAGEPFPGFLVEATLVVADYNGEGWAGRSLGLEYPQRITHIEGRRVQNSTQFGQLMTDPLIGQRVQLQSILPDGRINAYPEIPLSTFPRQDLLRFFWLPYIVGLVFLTLALWVYYLRGNTEAARLFTIFCLNAAVVTALMFDLVSTHMGTLIWTVAIAHIGGAMISLALLFPAEWRMVSLHGWIKYLPFSLSGLLAAWGVYTLTLSDNPWDYILAWRYSYFYIGFGILFFIGTMFFRLRTHPSIAVQQQARVILVGGLLAFFPISVWALAPIFNIVIHWNPVIFLPLLLLFPVFTSLAILRYHMWDISGLINRTLIYGTLSILLVFIYFALVTLLQQGVFGLSEQASPLLIAASTLLTALLFYPLRSGVQRLIERRFGRAKYDASQILAHFNAIIRHEVKLDTIASELVSVVKKTLQPDQIVLFTNIKTDITELLTFGLNDPLCVYLRSSNDAVELDKLVLDSSALETLRKANLKLAVPLVSQDEMVGLLALGQSLTHHAYDYEDRRLLTMLTGQAAPMLLIAQLAYQQEKEALERQRIDQEFQLARLVQRTLLPRDIPEIPGWKLYAHYQPARAVSGDFYDFFPLQDGRWVISIGDVSDKGMPAALVMATTRSVLRGAVRLSLPPSEALARTNNLLNPEMLESMFATCLYAIIDPHSGHICFANAGHNPPCWYHNGNVIELRATGMPLGLMPDMDYEEKEACILPGECILFYSDGLVEAHAPDDEMFGNPRLNDFMRQHANDGEGLISAVLAELYDFTGPNWEQEDDITLLFLTRQADAEDGDGQVKS